MKLSHFYWQSSVRLVAGIMNCVNNTRSTTRMRLRLSPTLIRRKCHLSLKRWKIWHSKRLLRHYCRKGSLTLVSFLTAVCLLVIYAIPANTHDCSSECNCATKVMWLGLSVLTKCILIIVVVSIVMIIIRLSRFLLLQKTVMRCCVRCDWWPCCTSSSTPHLTNECLTLTRLVNDVVCQCSRQSRCCWPHWPRVLFEVRLMVCCSRFTLRGCSHGCWVCWRWKN